MSPPDLCRYCAHRVDMHDTFGCAHFAIDDGVDRVCPCTAPPPDPEGQPRDRN